MVYVLTVDQRASRRTGDLVPALLAELNRRPGLLRRFERTAGDEVQGVFDDARAAVEVVVELLRADRWYIGLGVGDVTEPLPRSTRAGKGPAFVLAREAVGRAKSGTHHVNVAGSDERAAMRVETVLWLLAAVLRRRTERGWEVSDLLAEGLSRAEIAVKLGISQSAVSQRTQAAGVVEQDRAVTLATELLEGER